MIELANQDMFDFDGFVQHLRENKSDKRMGEIFKEKVHRYFQENFYDKLPEGFIDCLDFPLTQYDEVFPFVANGKRYIVTINEESMHKHIWISDEKVDFGIKPDVIITRKNVVPAYTMNFIRNLDNFRYFMNLFSDASGNGE